MDRTFAGGTHILVIALNIDEVASIKQSRCLIVGGLRLGHQWDDSVFATAQDLLTFEVAAVSEHGDLLPDGFLCPRRHVSQLSAIVPDGDDLMRHDEMML